MAGSSKAQGNSKAPSSASQQQQSSAQQQQQQNGGGGGAGGQQKVVGPNVQGTREEYQLVRRLQSALFGGVYEAKGLTTGKDFAIKVLHKSELTKAQETSSIEFCEVPLSEIRFAELMRGNENVMEPEEHFEDQYCFYVVFDLCRGGDLLEALKQKPHGFDELQAQSLIKQATQGLAYLHGRRVAMQDVSLENMLLHIDETTGNYRVKVCDPGQAAIFDLDANGEELQVNFRGLVGKSFRPPELHKQKSYHATKVDSWCLGWSTFYLLTAQPLFMSADPAQQDADWMLFQQGDYTTLFQQKSNLCSHTGLDFIFRLMQLEPSRRMSVADALEHAWLTDTKICPVLAPQELWPESLVKARGQPTDSAIPTSKSTTEQAHQQAVKDLDKGSLPSGTPKVPAGTPKASTGVDTASAVGAAGAAAGGAAKPGGPISWGAPAAGAASDVPTWAATAAGPGGVLRVQSPARSPRATAGAASGALQFDSRRSRGRQVQMQGGAARLPYVVATAHSPAPAGASPASPAHRVLGSATVRATSPLQGGQQAIGVAGQIRTHQSVHTQGAVQIGSQDGQPAYQQPTFMTPRMASRPRSPATKPATDGSSIAAAGDGSRQPAWAFKAEAGSEDGSTQDVHGRPLRAVSPSGATLGAARVVNPSPHGGNANVRYVQSPTRTQGAIYVQPRSPSPVQMQGMQLASAVRPTASQIRTASPVAAAARAGGGISWTQVSATFSPRATGALSRAASPMGAGVPAPIGFSFTPDPPSPRIDGRTMSPSPTGGYTFPKNIVPMASGTTLRGAPVVVRR